MLRALLLTCHPTLAAPVAVQVPDIDKAKFLVPSDLTVGQFVYVIRKRLSLPSDRALFLFLGNVLPPTSQLMSEAYAQHADEDGFLYVRYSGESTFG